MAFHGPDGPNMVIVRFIMDNVWSVAQLESYITSYRPGGPPLHVLRILMGHGELPPPAYAQCLSRLASILFGLGHVKPVNMVVRDLLRRVPPGLLTIQQVPNAMRVLRGIKKKGKNEWWKEGGGGGNKRCYGYCYPFLQNFLVSFCFPALVSSLPR